MSTAAPWLDVDPAAYTRALVEGMAQLIASLDTGLTWRADFAYLDTETGLWPMVLPVDVPGHAVAIAPYPLTADPARAQSEIGLQFRIRTGGPDVRDAWAIDDRLQNQLLGRWPMTLPTGVHVGSLTWTSGGSLGQDEQNRWEWASNWAARLYRPSVNRQ